MTTDTNAPEPKLLVSNVPAIGTRRLSDIECANYALGDLTPGNEQVLLLAAFGSFIS